MHVVEEVNIIHGGKGTSLHKYTTKLPFLSLLEYRAWLFGQPHSVNKDKLLELTLLAFPPEEKTQIYYQMSSSDEEFKRQLVIPYTLPSVLFSNEWYSYRHSGHFYVDFAHPKLFGGEFRSWGNLQEEIMFSEFPKLAHTAFATEDQRICCRDEWARPTPFLVPDVRRHTFIHDLYGDNLNRIRTEEIGNKVEYLEYHKTVNVHILGMAALRWQGKNQRYSEADLLDLLWTAFLAFDGAKMVASQERPVIHTGCWGCGACRNSQKTITVIQLLAAALADIEIVFDGMESPTTPHYTETFLEEAKTLVASKRNATEVCKEILNLQEKDLTWAPR